MWIRTLAAVLLLTVSGATGQDPDDRLSGVWTGGIVTPGGPLETSFHVEPDGEGGWTGTADTPVQGIYGLPLTGVELGAEGAVVFAMAHARYEGRLSADGRALDGVWKQGGREAEFDCARHPLPPPVPEDLRERLCGTWEGVLEAGVIELRIVLVLEAQGASAVRGRFASPDQGPTEAPVTRTDFLGGRRVRVAVGSAAVSMELALEEDGDRLAGKFRQGPAQLELALDRVERATEVRRPQEPRPPFPYRALEVSYENQAAGVKLAGTLTLPEGEGPFPAALLISGSGDQDRDEAIFQHKPFWVIADHLTRAGVAVLRVDDRGVGGSTAGEAGATTADFAGDVAAGVAFLAARPEIDGGRIGLIGHSEGGVIAPLVATGGSDVAFLVLLAGTGVPGDELLVMQGEAIARASGGEKAELAAALELQRGLFDVILDASLSEEEARERARALLEQSPDIPEGAEREGQIQAALAQLESPWLRWFLRHDPRPVLERVRCPVLALNGTLDLQVPWRANLEGIRGALAKGGNPDSTVRELAGLNHLFQHAETGLVTEYGHIEETFAPEVLELIAAWIVGRFVEGR